MNTTGINLATFRPFKIRNVFFLIRVWKDQRSFTWKGTEKIHFFKRLDTMSHTNRQQFNNKVYVIWNLYLYKMHYFWFFEIDEQYYPNIEVSFIFQINVVCDVITWVTYRAYREGREPMRAIDNSHSDKEQWKKQRKSILLFISYSSFLKILKK